MLTCCQLDPLNKLQVNSNKNTNAILPWKYWWKCRLQMAAMLLRRQCVQVRNKVNWWVCILYHCHYIIRLIVIKMYNINFRVITAIAVNYLLHDNPYEILSIHYIYYHSRKNVLNYTPHYPVALNSLVIITCGTVNILKRVLQWK